MGLLTTSTLLLFTSLACAAPDHRFLVGPNGIDPSTDCAMRWLTYNYSVHLLPQRAPLQSVFDALRLQLDCNATLPSTAAALPRPSRRASSSPSYAATYFADAVHGSDSNPGTQAAPFATIGRAVAASRSGPRPPQIVLRNGTFYLPSTIELGAADSGLSITAFPSESPVLSGGVPLAAMKWTSFQPPGPPPPNITGPTPGTLLSWAGGGCVDGPGKSNPGVCGPLGQFPDVTSCAQVWRSHPSPHLPSAPTLTPRPTMSVTAPKSQPHIYTYRLA